MNATVAWRQGMSFTGKADTGFEVPLGADVEVGGDDDGFRPLELMAVSLAGCTAMDVISILKKKKQEITGFRCQSPCQPSRGFPESVHSGSHHLPCHRSCRG